jgi:hypothetical protein
MAADGCQFTFPEILKAADHSGWTVAHEMAASGYVFVDEDILELATKSGERVRDVVAK